MNADRLSIKSPPDALVVAVELPSDDDAERFGGVAGGMAHRVNVWPFTEPFAPVPL
jgi:hypothetical protein